MHLPSVMEQQFLILGFLQLFSILEYVDIAHWRGLRVFLIYQKLVYIDNWKKYG